MILTIRSPGYSVFPEYVALFEDGSPAYTAKGQLSVGKVLEITNAAGQYCGKIEEKAMGAQHQYRVFDAANNDFGLIRQDGPSPDRFLVECNGWQVQGGYRAEKIAVTGKDGQPVVEILCERQNFRYTYTVDYVRKEDELMAFMVALVVLCVNME